MSGMQYKTRDDRVITVPDGMWVAEVRTGRTTEQVTDGKGFGYMDTIESREYQVIGVVPGSIQEHTLEARTMGFHGSDRKSYSVVSWLVCDRPFGVVCWQTKNGFDQPGRYFICSQRIHKGQFGAKPKIKRPKFAQATELDRHGNWRQNGWARLVDVVELVGMNPEDLLLTYFAYTHAEQPQLDVVLAESHEEIQGKQIGWMVRCTRSDIHGLVEDQLNNIWIRQGFATTILHLHHFDPQPSMVEVGD